MWCIARVDLPAPEYATNPPYSSFLAAPGLFGLVWAARMRDLPSFSEVRRGSGFVRDCDDLVMLRPDGTVKKINES